MFKSRFFVYQKHKGPGEGLPKKEGIDQPVSIKQDADKLAEQSEKAERKALGRLYSNLNEKIEDARQHIETWKLDEQAFSVNRGIRHWKEDNPSIKGINAVMGIIRDYINGFMHHASTNEMKLIKKHKPVLQMVLSKVNYMTFTVNFKNDKVIVDFVPGRGDLWGADTSKPAPLKETADRPPNKLKEEMLNRMGSAYKQFEETEDKPFGYESGMLLNMINDYLNATYNSFTATERASLKGMSIKKKLGSRRVIVNFASNNYTLR